MILLLSLLACGPEGGDDPSPLSVSIPFSATVGGEPFACGASYAGIGASEATITALDFRLYVYDLALIDQDGAAVPVALDQDNAWQYEDVALLDFEDGSADCATGSPDTRTEITGTVPAGDYRGLSFVVGVPPELNHIDAATAPAPLNDPGLWWAWTSGYKYARIDVATEDNPSFFFHLGATDCEAGGDGEYACALDNVPAIALDDFELDTHQVTVDLADFYADSDLDAAIDYVTDFVSGCMAFSGDPECTALMGRLGLPWGEAQDAPEQTFFKLEAL